MALFIRERDYPETSKLMHKAASGGIEHLNIFIVSNINSTLNSLKEKIFGYTVLTVMAKKNYHIIWDGNNVLYLDQKDME